MGATGTEEQIAPEKMNFRHIRIMAASAGTGAAKKLIRIDVCSDTVCPWCFVGKKYLDKAIAASKDQYDFEIRWHPYQLGPDAPKQGVDKRDFFRRKFGAQSERMAARMSEVFRSLDLDYNLSGLTGNTLDSHRLIYFAGKQGLDKQHNLVEELGVGYFTEAKFIGDRKFLLECADKVGVIGAGEFLANPNNGVDQVNEEFEKFCAGISGVPFFVINGKKKYGGAQSPEVLLKAFQEAAN
ncbi:hypothetical protein FNV43_RR14611 [Rhamnella rubrinervis]|uniref:DSBA-like thioredoxin domain-containing protein n=1 Tax=Rhamnella rubrinervis TaxID=2594499 RepID=A0A8K0H3E7_9ROSA|nr:hypothetical protein FNV43_RR14611 [Rhamnella rubrinervis]